MKTGNSGTNREQNGTTRALRDTLGGAERTIEELKAAGKKHEKSQKILEELTYTLKERVKELNCLYMISGIVEKQGPTLEEILQKTVDVIPDAWQYPESACSRIVLGNRSFYSDRFEETRWKQEQKIVLSHQDSGVLEVFYRDEKPQEDEGPFLKEERSLINVIAERIGEIVERKKAEEALQESESKNRALLNAIPDLMFQINQDGFLTGFHEGQFETLKGFSHIITGRSIYAVPELTGILSERILDQVMAHVKRTLETGRVQVFEQHIFIGEDRRDFEVSMVAYSATNVLGIVRDITVRKRLEREILEISGREQRRIGRDLHDGLCQLLAGIGFMGKVLEKKIVEHQVLEPGDVSEIVELLDQAITLTRGFARGLNPVRLESDGLMLALTELAANVERLFGISCHFDYTDDVLIGDNAVATHLYRIVQEALNNGIKHGRASTMTISLRQNEHNCILTVSDNGCGIGSATSQGKGMGMNIMQYRASVIGALLEVRNGAERGTVLTCSFQNKNLGTD